MNIAAPALLASLAYMAYAPAYAETVGILCSVVVLVAFIREGARKHPTH